MNTKLIMLPKPILVSDEKIVCGDMLLNKDNNYCVFRSEYQSRLPEYNNDSQVRKIIAGIEGLPSLDLSAIAEKIGWVDVEKLAISAFQKKFGRTPIIMGSAEADSSWLNTWIDGFKAAQSLNEKKFSEEDVILLCAELIAKYKLGKVKDESDVNKIVKSYSTPKEYQVEVEMEEYDHKEEWSEIGGAFETFKTRIKVTKILN